MLNLPTLASLIVTSLYLSPPATAQPLWPNTTNPTSCGTSSPSPKVAAAPLCQTLYPTEYRVMNSRYASWDQSPLHGQKDFFMLLRQRADTFQVTTQVQFDGLQSDVPPNSTCRLEFQLPTKETQTTRGAEPIFNVYQVEREAGAAATWSTYEPGMNQSVPMFGQVNGTVEAQKERWNLTGGVYNVGSTTCNETLTWQMGMAFDGGAEVNYWDFVDVQPPLNPVQGFRLLTGC